MGELIGYAQVSSVGQKLDVQVAALTAVGVSAEHLYSDKVSSTKRDGRQALDDLVTRGSRSGDTLAVTRLDRLARSTCDLHNVAHALTAKGASLRVLEQDIDTTTPEGRMVFRMLSAVAEFGTEIRKARQREGINAALAKGPNSPFKGRPATIEGNKVKAMQAEGMTPTVIAKALGVARSSVYRYLSGAG